MPITPPAIVADILVECSEEDLMCLMAVMRGMGIAHLLSATYEITEPDEDLEAIREAVSAVRREYASHHDGSKPVD